MADKELFKFFLRKTADFFQLFFNGIFMKHWKTQ